VWVLTTPPPTTESVSRTLWGGHMLYQCGC